PPLRLAIGVGHMTLEACRYTSIIIALALLMAADAPRDKAKADKLQPAKGDDFEWSLKEPKAELFDDKDTKVGRHFRDADLETTGGAAIKLPCVFPPRGPARRSSPVRHLLAARCARARRPMRSMKVQIRILRGPSTLPARLIRDGFARRPGREM